MMELLQIVVLTTIAGAAIPIGGLLARVERLQPRWLEREFRHAVIAFGGGVLLSAVALVLVPEGIKQLPLVWVVISFCLGGLAFCLLDVALARAKTPAAQLAAMLSDFLPEALALGAAFSTGHSVGILLAVLIALQNLPEGFNAFRELASSKRVSQNKALVAFVAMLPLGPLAGVIGLYWLSQFPAMVGAIMLFAAGGILYLTFQDIAPQAKLERHWAPTLGAVAGFLFGLIGRMLIVQ